MVRRGLLGTVCMIIGLSVIGANMAAAEDTVIKGYLTFENGGVVELPPDSTYRVELRDVSLMDAPSVLIATYVGRVDEDNTSDKPFDFEIVLPEEERVKRGDRPHTLALSAVVNAGWERTDNSSVWIRQGDYLSDTIHFLDLKEGQFLIEDYSIKVRQYKH